MMLRSDATGIRPVIQAELLTSTAPVSSPSLDAFNRLMQVSIGKQFQAEVMLRQNDGSYLVRLANTTARMALPEGTQAGDTVSLTLVAAAPRPTFLLGETTVNATPLPGQQTAAAGLLIDNLPPGAKPDEAEQADGGDLGLGNAGGNKAGRSIVDDAAIAGARTSQIAKTATTVAATANQPTDPAFTSTITTLSSTGRLIDSLLHASEQGNMPAGITGKMAIVSSPDVAPTKLAEAMHKTLEFSGLFYESHVEEWANGKRAAEALAKEPQAQLSAEKASLAGLQASTGSAQNPDASAQAAMLNSDAAHLIRMQLNTLENRHVVWQGELWPGQHFEWEVSDETPQRQEAAEAAPSWRSQMRFELPALGTITASLVLAGGHVQVQLRTATEEAAAAIRPYAGDLASALDAAGSPLDLLTVKQDGTA
ncbi:MAG: flagellar hook-length control protein FliK [Burkholderiaceae bacterium]|nr:flagellar hook-length control protein FliK [Burkholderiaceae bacterium]